MATTHPVDPERFLDDATTEQKLTATPGLLSRDGAITTWLLDPMLGYWNNERRRSLDPHTDIRHRRSSNVPLKLVLYGVFPETGLGGSHHRFCANHGASLAEKP